MLPGTFMYVYLGSLGRAAAAGHDAGLVERARRGIGLLATMAATAYVARVTRDAIRRRTRIEEGEAGPRP